MSESFRWNTERGEATLESIAAFVDEVSRDLDPGSRYVTELKAVLAASADVDDYRARLADGERVETFRQDGSKASHGERGRSWVDRSTWAEMSVWEQTLSNLLTGETRMMWAGEGAADFGRLDEVLARLPSPTRILSIPCSTGKEPFSLAIAGLRARREVEVTGVDRQESYLERARSGTLVPHWRDLELPGADVFFEWDAESERHRVSDEVRSLCTFSQGDVLTGELPEGPFHLVSCRNLLGYFRGESLRTAWRNVASRLAPEGVLLHDGFVSDSEEMRPVQELLQAGGFRRLFPDANFYGKE